LYRSSSVHAWNKNNGASSISPTLFRTYRLTFLKDWANILRRNEAFASIGPGDIWSRANHRLSAPDRMLRSPSYKCKLFMTAWYHYTSARWTCLSVDKYLWMQSSMRHLRISTCRACKSHGAPILREGTAKVCGMVRSSGPPTPRGP
jgi:hypothetical protein